MTQPAAETHHDYVSALGLSENQRHSLLADGRRRLALDLLAERTAPTDLDGLAAEIASAERGLDADDPETLQRVKIELHHVHLPKMDDFGVVTYDAESRRIEL